MEKTDCPKYLCANCGTLLVCAKAEKWAQVRFILGSIMFVLLFIVMWGQYSGLESRMKGFVYQAGDEMRDKVQSAYMDMGAHYTLYDAYAKEHDPTYISWLADYRLRMKSR